MVLIADYYYTTIFLTAVHDFQLYGVAAVCWQFKGGLALGEAFLHQLGVIETLVKAGTVGDVDFHRNQATGLSNDSEFLMALGGKGPLGALAGTDKAGLGEVRAVSGLATMGGGAVHVVCLVINGGIARSQAVGKGFVKNEMAVERGDRVIFATERIETGGS